MINQICQKGKFPFSLSRLTQFLILFLIGRQQSARKLSSNWVDRVNNERFASLIAANGQIKKQKNEREMREKKRESFWWSNNWKRLWRRRWTWRRGGVSSLFAVRLWWNKFTIARSKTIVKCIKEPVPGGRVVDAPSDCKGHGPISPNKLVEIK